MRKVIFFVGMVSFLAYLNANEIIINPNDNELGVDGDVVNVTIKSNDSYCQATISSIRTIEDTDCLRIINSKKEKILCSSDKKICKTEKEVIEYVYKKLTESEPKVVNDSSKETDEHNTSKIDENKSVSDPNNKMDILNYTQQCTKGDGESCFLLGKQYLNGNESVAQDFTKAAIFLQDACNHSHNVSCAYYGTLLMAGFGTNKNINKGIDLIQKSCEEMTHDYGQTDACMSLGIYYIKGEIVSYNPDKGKMLLSKSCENGNNSACDNFGYIYQTIFKNDIKAEIYYTKACNNGKASACYNLGNMLRNKVDFGNDAKKMYEKSCNLGLEEGCNILRQYEQ